MKHDERAKEIERVKPQILEYAERSSKNGIEQCYFEVDFMGYTKAFTNSRDALNWLAHERNRRPMPDFSREPEPQVLSRTRPTPKAGAVSFFGGDKFFIFIGFFIGVVLALVADMLFAATRCKL